jgi:hypothetical protein
VGFYSEEGEIYGAYRLNIVGDCGMGLKVTFRATNTHSVGLHRSKVRATSDKISVLPHLG